MYYNTTRLTGQALINEILNSNGQESKVLTFFINNPNTSYAPHVVKTHVLPLSPITSVRRALTNLTNANILIKTNTKVTGTYGKPVYTWRLNPNSTTNII